MDFPNSSLAEMTICNFGQELVLMVMSILAKSGLQF